jgi:MFS family permease
MTEPAGVSTGTWRELLGPGNIGASTVLAGDVALYATNAFLTISLMPSAVADIGGQRFYAWVTTVYLVASVVSATTVNSLLFRLGPRLAYLLGLGGQPAVPGSAGHGTVPRRPWCPGCRRRSACGVGLCSDQGYAVINTALPKTLWTKASASVSAMWGVVVEGTCFCA